MRRIDEAAGDRQLLSTYRYLRMAMPALGLLLACSVAIQVVRSDPDCWLGSISAYYYTAARAVFVACLCAIGTCLVVYRGTTDREDVVLNISGSLAFFVALIPTPLADAKDGTELADCGRTNVPTSAQLSEALFNNIWSAVFVFSLMALAFLVFRFGLPKGAGRPPATATKVSVTAAAALIVGYAAFPGVVHQYGHYAAAIGLFAGVGLMAAMNAWPRLAGPRQDGSDAVTSAAYERAYRTIVGLMVLAVLVFVPLIVAGRANGLFWLEATLIAAFVAFWVLQTIENWMPTGATSDHSQGAGPVRA